MIAGVDEAGRGPLAGPVVAAAVILNPEKPIQGLADSKLLSAKKRNALFDLIYERAFAVSIAEASHQEIDRINILRASLLAMQRAVLGLSLKPLEVWVDGPHYPNLAYPGQAIVNGDALVPAISAASIIAKVTRDRKMQELDEFYPGYGFGKHFGYPTQEHIQALARLGASPIHRQSFRPVSALRR